MSRRQVLDVDDEQRLAKADAAAEPVRSAIPAAFSPASVPLLQRLAGNRAVAQRIAIVVQRDAGWTQQVRDFKRAVSAQDWTDAARRLNNFQRPDWSWHIKQPPPPLTVGQLAAIRQVVQDGPGSWGWQIGFLDFLNKALGGKQKSGPATSKSSTVWEIRSGTLMINKPPGRTAPLLDNATFQLADVTSKEVRTISFQQNGKPAEPPSDWAQGDGRGIVITQFDPQQITTGRPVTFAEFNSPGRITFNGNGSAGGAVLDFRPGGADHFVNLGFPGQPLGVINGSWVVAGKTGALTPRGGGGGTERGDGPTDGGPSESGRGTVTADVAGTGGGTQEEQAMLGSASTSTMDAQLLAPLLEPVTSVDPSPAVPAAASKNDLVTLTSGQTRLDPADPVSEPSSTANAAADTTTSESDEQSVPG